MNKCLLIYTETTIWGSMSANLKKRSPVGFLRCCGMSAWLSISVERSGLGMNLTIVIPFSVDICH